MLPKVKKSRTGLSRMLLRELFPPERIIDNIEAVNKEELFRESRNSM